MAKVDKNHDNVLTMQNEANPNTLSKVAKCISLFSRIKWRRVTFEIPTKPEPSHRPRLCGYRVYVPGAAKNQSFFNKKVLPTLKGLFITTPCNFDVDIYCETPKSFSKVQKLLALRLSSSAWRAFCSSAASARMPASCSFSPSRTSCAALILTPWVFISRERFFRNEYRLKPCARFSLARMYMYQTRASRFL